MLKVEKSCDRRLVTLEGDERVTEIVKYYPVDGGRFVSESLRSLTPFRSPYSFDLLARVGRLRFSKHFQIMEIQGEIGWFGPFIPRSTLQRLCVRFLCYFIAVHLESLPLFADHICVNGGYVLQIDGSQNHGRGTLLLVKDMVSGFRLFACRFHSENKEDLVVLFSYLNRLYCCSGCGEVKVVHFGCNSRVCTHCEKRFSDKWADSIARKTFDVKHRHVILIIPEALRSVFHEDKTFLKVLMDCAISTISDVKKTLVLLHPPPKVKGRISKNEKRLRDRKEWFDEVACCVTLA